MSRKIGDVILDLQNISLRFGGVKALTDISFDIREHEVRAIIGPNGAGKSSMLNVINGVYHPQDGKIMFRGVERKKMEPHLAAKQGISRTFQNIALFKGMSVLDNIMTGRTLKIKSNLLLQALWIGPARNEEIAHRRKVEEIIDFNDHFGTTIVLIEHDMGVVMDISDRVVVLDYGKKIGDGLPDEVRASPEVIKAYLGAGH